MNEREPSNRLNYKGLFKGWEVAIAKRLVYEAVKAWPVFSRDDFEDLVEEVLIHWLKKKDAYDPKREANPRTFMAAVVRNKLRDIKDARKADKRKIAHEALSLDEPVGDEEDSSTLHDSVPSSRSSTQFTELDKKIALERALEELSPRQLDICEMSEKGFTVTEIAEFLKTPRSTIYDELARIRKHFSKHGLGGDD